MCTGAIFVVGAPVFRYLINLDKRRNYAAYRKDRIERAARIYASNTTPARPWALPRAAGPPLSSYGIETPQARKRRQRSEWTQDYRSLHNREEQ